MNKQDLYLYNALIDKINNKGIQPELCNICTPRCKTYQVRLFSKKFTVEINTHNTVIISSWNTIPYCTLLFKLSDIEFYNDNPDLLIN